MDLHRFVHVEFVRSTDAKRFLQKDIKWKEKYGWVVEWSNKQREEE
jgi:hypothetical protein